MYLGCIWVYLGSDWGVSGVYPGWLGRIGGLAEGWRRAGGGMEEGRRRHGGGSEVAWRRVGGGLVRPSVGLRRDLIRFTSIFARNAAFC